MLVAGNGASILGSHFGQFAIPLIAVVDLHVDPAELGLLLAAGSGASVIFGPFAGAWMDIAPRRTVLAVSNLCLTLVFGMLAIVALSDRLSLPLYLGTVTLIGALSSCGVAVQATLPSIVPEAQLARANSRLVAGTSAVSVVGPGLAAAFTRIASAPWTLLGNGFCSMTAALFFSRISTKGPLERLPAPSRLHRRVGEALRLIRRDPFQRSLTVIGGLQVFLGSTIGPVYLVYLIRTLHFDVAWLGLLGATGAGGAIVGSLAVPRLLARAGFGRMLLGATGILALSPALAVAAAPGVRLPAAVTMLTIGTILGGIAVSITSILLTSLRLSMTEPVILGRIMASHNAIMAVLGTIGSLMGGILASVAGAYGAVIVTACLRPLIVVAILRSPVRRAHPNDDRLQSIGARV